MYYYFFWGKLIYDKLALLLCARGLKKIHSLVNFMLFYFFIRCSY